MLFLPWHWCQYSKVVEMLFTNYTAKAQNKAVFPCFYTIKLSTVTKVPCTAKLSSSASFPISHFIPCFLLLPSNFKMVAKGELIFFSVSKWHPLWDKHMPVERGWCMFYEHMDTRQCIDFLWLTNSECLCMANSWLQAGKQGAQAPSALINNRTAKLLPWAVNQLKTSAATLNSVSRQCRTEH